RALASNGLTDVAAATFGVTAAHAGHVITLNRATGIAVTLPAASGTGNRFKFVVGTSVSGGSTTIKVANASDVMCGNAVLFQDSGDTVVGFAAGSTADTITMDGSTQGGLKGAVVDAVDVGANLWHVNYVSDASGTEASPFSATVS